MGYISFTDLRNRIGLDEGAAQVDFNDQLSTSDVTVTRPAAHMWSATYSTTGTSTNITYTLPLHAANIAFSWWTDLPIYVVFTSGGAAGVNDGWFNITSAYSSQSTSSSSFAIYPGAIAATSGSCLIFIPIRPTSFLHYTSAAFEMAAGYMHYGLDDNGNAGYSIYRFHNTSGVQHQINLAMPNYGTYQCGYFNSPVSNYTMGGWNGGALINAVDKFNRSAITTSALGAIMTSAVRLQSSGANSLARGYLVGGYTTTEIGASDRITFSDDSFSRISAFISTARRYVCGIQDASNGRWSGGYSSTPAVYATTLKMAWGTDTTATTTTAITTARQEHVGFNNATSGYYAHGWTVANASINTIVRYVWAAETQSVISAVMTLPVARGGGMSFSNRGICGYTYRGSLATNLGMNYVYELNFSTETTSELTVGSIGVATKWTTAGNNESWYVGG
jgi:hypothetical protein